MDAMTLAVVAYPALEDRDRDWIEFVRARHDPQALRIQAHFTLVFPTEASADSVAAHVAAVAVACAPPSFVAFPLAVRDPMGAGSHVFLVPEQGRDAIAALHDRLYDGPLRKHLRPDIPFVPHITLASCETFEASEALSRRLSMAHAAVRGSLREVELIEVGPSYVKTLVRIGLGAGADSLHPPSDR